MERQKDYILDPTEAKPDEISTHEEYILQAVSEINVHSHRIISTFRQQVGYESNMDLFIRRHSAHLRSRNQQGTKPHSDQLSDGLPSQQSEQEQTNELKLHDLNGIEINELQRSDRMPPQ